MVGEGGVDAEEEEQGKRCVEMWMTRPSGKERGMRVAEANHSWADGGGEEEDALVLLFVEGMSVYVLCVWGVVFVFLRMKEQRLGRRAGQQQFMAGQQRLPHILGL
jgi:hypothetical protein